MKNQSSKNTASSNALQILNARCLAIGNVVAKMEAFLTAHQAAFDAYAETSSIGMPGYLCSDSPLSLGKIYLRRHEENIPAAKALTAALGGKWIKQIASGAEYFDYVGDFDGFSVKLVCAEKLVGGNAIPLD